MSLGTAAHYLVLENSRPFVECSARRGSNEWKDAVEQAGDERMVLKPDEFDTITRMKESLMRNREIKWMIENTKHEVSMFWNGDYGRAKGRLDILGNNFFADYKTTNDATPRNFFNVSECMGYHLKMGWYAEGLAALGVDIPFSKIIVQENKHPFDCGIIEIPAEIIEDGRKQAREIAMQWMVACKTGIYLGQYAHGPIQYERPGWSTYGEEEDTVNMDGIEE